MARGVITDLLQAYPFWLMDVGPVTPLALPILTPLFGFSAITAPEITVDIVDIKEGNWIFHKKLVKGADVSNITLERGIVFYDSDFWRWTYATISGDLSSASLGIPGTPVSLQLGGVTPRRTMMLVHFFSRNSIGLGGPLAGLLVETGLAAAGAAMAAGGGIANTAIATATAAADTAAIAALGMFLGPFEFAARIPAKAWMLYGCVPARYKAASDFDASSGAISIQQLEMAVEMMEEISLVS